MNLSPFSCLPISPLMRPKTFCKKRFSHQGSPNKHCRLFSKFAVLRSLLCKKKACSVCVRDVQRPDAEEATSRALLWAEFLDPNFFEFKIASISDFWFQNKKTPQKRIAHLHRFISGHSQLSVLPFEASSRGESLEEKTKREKTSVSIKSCMILFNTFQADIN